MLVGGRCFFLAACVLSLATPSLFCSLIWTLAKSKRVEFRVIYCSIIPTVPSTY